MALSNFDRARIGYDKIAAFEKEVRSAAIQECADLMQRWSDECKDFQGETFKAQHNICGNAAIAIRNLDK
jgi:hypothetical protein